MVADEYLYKVVDALECGRGGDWKNRATSGAEFARSAKPTVASVIIGKREMKSNSATIWRRRVLC